MSVKIPKTLVKSCLFWGGVLAIALPSIADGLLVTTIEEGGKVFVGNVTPGVLWLCENVGCVVDPNDTSDLTFIDASGNVHHTGASDQILFGIDAQGNPSPGYATMCSDTQTPDNDDTACQVFAPNLYLDSERVGGPQGGVERVFYLPPPGSGEPGAPNNPNDPAVVYELISDVPEPASMLLLGSVLIGLASVIRKKLV